jgi:hypothetical protein
MRSILHMNVSEWAVRTDCGFMIISLLHRALPTVGPEKPWYFASATRNSRDWLVVHKVLVVRKVPADPYFPNYIYILSALAWFGNILIFWGWVKDDVYLGIFDVVRHTDSCGFSDRIHFHSKSQLVPFCGSFLPMVIPKSAIPFRNKRCMSSFINTHLPQIKKYIQQWLETIDIQRYIYIHTQYWEN